MRGMNFAERGALLKAMSKALYTEREELLRIASTLEACGRLRRIGRAQAGEAARDDIYVWWGKIRSPNRRGALPHADAIAALDEYGGWLESELLPRSKGDFRLGEDLWRKKLKYALASDLTQDVTTVLEGESQPSAESDAEKSD